MAYLYVKNLLIKTKKVQLAFCTLCCVPELHCLIVAAATVGASRMKLAICSNLLHPPSNLHPYICL